MKRAVIAVLAVLLIGLSIHSAVSQTSLPSPRLPLILKGESYTHYFPLVLGRSEPGRGQAAPLPTPTASATATPSPTPEPAANPACANLVHRDGERLVLNGQPVVFVGLNATCLMEPALPDSMVTDVLDTIAGWGATMIRLWVKPGSDLDRFERVLDQAGERDLRLVVTLQDYYFYKSAGWFRTTYKEVDVPHIKEVVTRFRDRPEIAIWELMNEPWCGAEGEFDDPKCYRTLESWAKNTSRLIRSLDPCRPISVGTSSERHAPEEKEGYRMLQAIDTIDIVSVHKDSAKWYQHPAELELARELGKPVMLGEIWEWAYDKDCRPRYDGVLADRAKKLDRDMHKALELGVDVYLLWNYAAGSFRTSDGGWMHSCGEYDYFGDDPVGRVIEALPIPRIPVSR